MKIEIFSDLPGIGYNISMGILDNLENFLERQEEELSLDEEVIEN